MQKKRAIDHIQQVNNQDFRLHIFTALKAATCNASILKRGWAIGGESARLLDYIRQCVGHWGVV